MKRYTRHLTHNEVVNACLAKGFLIDTSKYAEGSDYVRIEGTIEGTAFSLLYASWNGRFFGTTIDGVQFTCGSTEHDGHPWFDALLDFFYKV